MARATRPGGCIATEYSRVQVVVVEGPGLHLCKKASCSRNRRRQRETRKNVRSKEGRKIAETWKEPLESLHRLDELLREACAVSIRSLQFLRIGRHTLHTALLQISRDRKVGQVTRKYRSSSNSWGKYGTAEAFKQELIMLLEIAASVASISNLPWEGRSSPRRSCFPLLKWEAAEAAFPSQF